MSINSAFATLRRKLDARAMSGARIMADAWATQARVTAPTGPTGNLQRGMTATVRRVFGVLFVRLHGDQPYAVKQRDDALTHVPRDVVGVKGWHDFAKVRGNRSRRYYSGLRAALAAGTPRYRWNYPLEAWRRAGGIVRLRKAMEGRG